MMLAEYEIDQMLTRFDKDETPRLYEAAQALGRLRDWTNLRSDGWMYWRKPSQASIRLQERLNLADMAGRRNGAVDDITLEEWSRLFRPVRQFLGDQKVDDPDLLLFPPPPPPPPGRGILLTREQLEDWAQRSLTDEEVEDLDNAIPNSSVPEAIATICDGFGGDDQ